MSLHHIIIWTRFRHIFLHKGLRAGEVLLPEGNKRSAITEDGAPANADIVKLDNVP